MNVVNEETGRLLGHLYNKVYQNGSEELDDDDLLQVNHLEALLHTLKSSNQWQQMILHFSDDQCAIGKKVFLETNTYLGFIFLGFDNLPSGNERFFIHLNSCYHCFEAFSYVMRDFIKTANLDEAE